MKGQEDSLFLNKIKIDEKSGCWLWNGTIGHDGYGKITRNGKHGLIAHRYAYELYRGEIPPGMFVCHTCDNQRCVNPDHLFLGTHYDNMRDMINKGRAKPKRSSGFCSLTDCQVAELINLSGHTPKIQLARMFCVSPRTVRSIIKNNGYAKNALQKRAGAHKATDKPSRGVG